MWVSEDAHTYLSLGAGQLASLGEGEDAGRCSSSVIKAYCTQALCVNSSGSGL